MNFRKKSIFALIVLGCITYQWWIGILTFPQISRGNCLAVYPHFVVEPLAWRFGLSGLHTANTENLEVQFTGVNSTAAREARSKVLACLCRESNRNADQIVSFYHSEFQISSEAKEVGIESICDIRDSPKE